MSLVVSNFSVTKTFIIISAIVLCLVGISTLIFNQLSESYFEIAGDKCLELNGKLVQYSGCNSFLGSCPHESGLFCLLSNGSEISIQINSSGGTN